MGVGFEKSGKKAISDASIKAFNFSILLSPVISFWDCIVRKMRYSFRPEWVLTSNWCFGSAKIKSTMEKPGCGQQSSFLKKGKKKQAKDELDRQKQAEKKRRRLEKALANSAAIRSELEKKKQKKKEEQQCLDEEGAAIAEAVALQVLVGEDIEESHHFMLDSSRRYCNNPYYNSGDIGLIMGYHQGFGKYSMERHGWPNDARRSLPNEVQSPFYEENYWQDPEISAGLMAAQAVESLQIAEDSRHGGTATVFFNRMMGNNNIGGGLNFYKEI